MPVQIHAHKTAITGLAQLRVAWAYEREITSADIDDCGTRSSADSTLEPLSTTIRGLRGLADHITTAGVESSADFLAEDFAGWHRIGADPSADLHPWQYDTWTNSAR